jgi:hypothetical protein
MYLPPEEGESQTRRKLLVFSCPKYKGSLDEARVGIPQCEGMRKPVISARGGTLHPRREIYCIFAAERLYTILYSKPGKY